MPLELRITLTFDTFWSN